MPRSDASLPERFTRIDELTRPDHYWLTDDDLCYFLGDYAAGQGYAHEWDVRELLVQYESAPPSHQAATGERRGPQEIADGYCIDESRSTPEPDRILLVDDVLTTGAHFAAAKSVLSNRFPQAAVVGLFVARRVPGGAAGSGQ